MLLGSRRPVGGNCPEFRLESTEFRRDEGRFEPPPPPELDFIVGKCEPVALWFGEVGRWEGRFPPRFFESSLNHIRKVVRMLLFFSGFELLDAAEKTEPTL